MNVEATIARMIAEETETAPTVAPADLDDMEYPTARDLLRVADPYAMVGDHLEAVRRADGEIVAYYEACRILRRVLYAARTSRQA